MAYGIPFNEVDSLTEGQQAEEYLKKKLDDKKNQAKSDKFKYHSTMALGSGVRGQGERPYYDDDDDEILNIGGGPTITPTTDRNPRYKTARNIRRYRGTYDDVMPRQTKSEKEYSDAIAKEIKERKYAASMKRSDRSDLDNQMAMDAARRHYRRTHKNESSIFESVEIL